MMRLLTAKIKRQRYVKALSPTPASEKDGLSNGVFTMGVCGELLVVATFLIMLTTRVDGNCWAKCNAINGSSIITSGVFWCEEGSGMNTTLSNSVVKAFPMSSSCELVCNSTITNAVSCLMAINETEDVSSLITAL